MKKIFSFLACCFVCFTFNVGAMHKSIEDDDKGMFCYENSEDGFTRFLSDFREHSRRMSKRKRENHFYILQYKGDETKKHEFVHSEKLKDDFFKELEPSQVEVCYVVNVWRKGGFNIIRFIFSKEDSEWICGPYHGRYNLSVKEVFGRLKEDRLFGDIGDDFLEDKLKELEDFLTVVEKFLAGEQVFGVMNVGGVRYVPFRVNAGKEFRELFLNKCDSMQVNEYALVRSAKEARIELDWRRSYKSAQGKVYWPFARVLISSKDEFLEEFTKKPRD